MSPEQFKSTRDVTTRTDVWALGAILYRLLTAALPFEGRDYVELCSNIMTQSPPAIEHRRPTVSPALAAIVRRCLEKDPTQRFADACELRDALRAFAAQTKTNPRLVMAATVPFNETIAPVVLPTAAPLPAKKRRSLAPLFAIAAAFAGLVTFGGMHRTTVMHYVHPAPVQGETPATASTEPLEASATTIAMNSASEPKAATVKVARRAKNRVR